MSGRVSHGDYRSPVPRARPFTLSGLHGDYDLALPLIGDHQLENAAAAVAAAETLSGLGHNITSESITNGIRDVRWEGRLQVLQAGPPPVVVDGAHNRTR